MKTIYTTETLTPYQLCEKIRSVSSEQDLSDFLFECIEEFAQIADNEAALYLAKDILRMVEKRLEVEQDNEPDAYSAADAKYPGHFID